MNLTGIDEYPEVFGIDCTVGAIVTTTTPHKLSSEQDMPAPISDQRLSIPYAYDPMKDRTLGSPGGEATQSYLELTHVRPPSLIPTDTRQAVMPSSLESGQRNQACPESKRRPRISPAKWEQIRPAFATLYRDQYKTLADTRKILEEEHGFKASEKLFKDKIKAWGLCKNLKRQSETNVAVVFDAPPGPLDENPEDFIFDTDIQGLASLSSDNGPDTFTDPWMDYQWGYVGNQAFSEKTEHNEWDHSGSESFTSFGKEILARLDMAFAKIKELELRIKAYHE